MQAKDFNQREVQTFIHLVEDEMEAAIEEEQSKQESN